MYATAAARAGNTSKPGYIDRYIDGELVNITIRKPGYTVKSYKKWQKLYIHQKLLIYQNFQKCHMLFY